MTVIMASLLRQRTHSVRAFARTTGQITRCDVDVALDDATNRFRLNITYRYTAAGQEYVGTRVCADTAPDEPPALSRRQVERLVRAFSKGRPVTVFYNPANPQDACLIESARRFLPVRWLGLLLGAG
jgi:hypothetical protein